MKNIVFLKLSITISLVVLLCGFKSAEEETTYFPGPTVEDETNASTQFDFLFDKSGNAFMIKPVDANYIIVWSEDHHPDDPSITFYEFLSGKITHRLHSEYTCYLYDSKDLDNLEKDTAPNRLLTGVVLKYKVKLNGKIYQGDYIPISEDNTSGNRFLKYVIGLIKEFTLVDTHLLPSATRDKKSF
ncbi:MAG: hypothetical protein IK120_06940 [Muribaculaceae bacterium]|nr:hypothetical protein [Muribaculaceae bacterium]